ncbi:hypothetical protein CLOACE_17450 [Clostridium acetireducens DSM 10703]|uniref:PhoU domain-containing protein n=1 Tax=Clostridium acetireducens DSM 10703 TaxID=1121290 RepID=A0A1E8EXF5_9CLOT|nr:phosphate signaling complex protein PhoU [Clostridium acetireducens]OFI05449.1 hypothetical protein CLOACE_17450 [Clostridium acetireducens DSM 10703]
MLRKNFDYNLQVLRSDVLRMGNIVEKQIHESIKALINQNEELAQKIIVKDDLVDELQKEIEYKCVKLIAKEQPLAEDLRFIFTTIKIVTDLERMADHAVDICKIAILLKNEKYIKELINIPKISEIVKIMIEKVLEAYVSKDINKCYYVCKMDDDIDGLYRKTFDELIDIMRKLHN